jgi:hypothetical protein
MAYNLYTPRTWQFWSTPQLRPKRVFEGVLLFSDLMFGGEGFDSFPPYLVKSFSRPGYNRIETAPAEYQLRSGDFAKIDYPTQAFTTSPLRVTLVDVNVGGLSGADSAGHVSTALGMMQKTWNFESVAGATEEGKASKTYDSFIQGYVGGNPKIITILELDGKGGYLGEWNMFRPVLTSATFSDINYDRAELATIDLRFEYKNFNFETPWSKRELRRRLKTAASERSRYLSEAVDWATEKAASITDWYDSWDMPTSVY